MVTAPVTNKETEDIDTLILRGDEAFQKNAYESALAAYTKAIRLEPGNNKARRMMRVVLTELGRQAEAQNYR
jgi:Flp pilus assembly protein TadD